MEPTDSFKSNRKFEYHHDCHVEQGEVCEGCLNRGGNGYSSVDHELCPVEDIRESVDSLCRDDADMPMPPYLSLFR